MSERGQGKFATVCNVSVNPLRTHKNMATTDSFNCSD